LLSASTLAFNPSFLNLSGSYGQLGHAQLHALHLMQADHAFVVDHPRKLDSLDPFRLQPWKR
jgi:hypothetical protein